MYAYKGGSLYQATYLNERDDIEAGDCVLRQLKYKAEGGEAEGGEAEGKDGGVGDGAAGADALPGES